MSIGTAARLPGWSGAIKAPHITAAVVLLSLLKPWQAGDVTDVSWLIVVCEKLLAGETLYVDILETNPPFSVALYIGPVWLAKGLGLAPELAVEFFVYVVFFIALALTSAVIERGRLFAREERRWACPALAVLLLILPGGIFGQREHIGVMLFMPMLAMMMWRGGEAGDRAPTAGLAILTGLAASVLLLVKPHWALGIAVPYLVICWRRRSPFAWVTIENAVIGAICTAYLTIVIVWFGVFLDTFLPLLLRYYVGFRSHVNLLIAGPAFVFFAAFVVMQRRGSRWRSEVAIALASATGFFVSTVYLGKYWNNHQYPHLVALSVAMMLALSHRRQRMAAGGRIVEETNLRLHSQAAALVLLALILGQHLYPNPERHLVEAIRSRYQSPSIVQISSDLSVGHPLTRMVNGRWAPGYAHDWVGGHALSGLLEGSYQGEARTRARQDLDDYTRYVNSLIRDHRPDIVLLERSRTYPWSGEEYHAPLWVAWMQENAEFQALMARYEEIAAGAYVQVLARRASAPALP